MQINSLANLLKEFRVEKHADSIPSPTATPKPQRNKVVADPTRAPINRQAALLVQPVRCWLSQPLPPAKLPNPFQNQMDALTAELRTERNAHALTRDRLGQCRAELKQQKTIMQALQREIVQLGQEAAEKDSIIRQLEDIRL